LSKSAAESKDDFETDLLLGNSAHKKIKTVGIYDAILHSLRKVANLDRNNYLKSARTAKRFSNFLAEYNQAMAIESFEAERVNKSMAIEAINESRAWPPSKKVRALSNIIWRTEKQQPEDFYNFPGISWTGLVYLNKARGHYEYFILLKNGSDLFKSNKS